MLGLNLQHARGNEVERGIPRRGLELTRGSANQRRRDSVRHCQQAGAGPALLAQPATVRREVPGHDFDATLLGDVESHAALQRAVGAMCVDTTHRFPLVDSSERDCSDSVTCHS